MAGTSSSGCAPLLLQEVFTTPDISMGSGLWQPLASLSEYDAVENCPGMFRHCGPLPTFPVLKAMSPWENKVLKSGGAKPPSLKSFPPSQCLSYFCFSGLLPGSHLDLLQSYSGDQSQNLSIKTPHRCCDNILLVHWLPRHISGKQNKTWKTQTHIILKPRVMLILVRNSLHDTLWVGGF